MNIWTYLQIEFFPFLALALILFISAIEFKSFKNIRLFQCLVIMIMCILAVDAFNWYTVLNPMVFPTAILWFSNIVYFLLTEIIAFLWFRYVFFQVCGAWPAEKRRRWQQFSLIPFCLICVVIITSPWNHLIFTIDGEINAYCRGSLHILQMVIGFAYMLLASVLAFIRSRKTVLSEEKNECRFLCYIIILPLLGGVLQIVNYDFVFLWSFTAAAAFLIFIDFQSHQISVDTLTSLNNRGNLERYLQSRAKDHRLCGYLIMIDIDHFKSINDSFGHIEGDRALKIVAKTLRNVFAVRGAFLSRYGGDEFVVIADLPDPDVTIARCEDELLRIKNECGMPYEIHLTCGYTKCDHTTDTAAIGNLVKQADEMMYDRKRHKDT